MSKLSRRWGAVASVMLLISSVGFGTAWSYLRTAHTEFGKSLRDAVPIMFELQRLEQLTRDVIPEIRANQKVAAQLDVEIDYMTKELDQWKQAQIEAMAQMRKLRTDLASGQNEFLYGDRRWTRPEVERELAHRMDRFQNAQDQQSAKDKILESRRQTLMVATDKIRQYQHHRDLLVEKTESLQVELKLAELAQTEGGFHFDQSKLERAKLLAHEVEKKVRTLQKIVASDRDIGGDIPVETDARPVTQRFDEMFASDNSR